MLSLDQCSRAFLNGHSLCSRATLRQLVPSSGHFAALVESLVRTSAFSQRHMRWINRKNVDAHRTSAGTIVVDGVVHGGKVLRSPSQNHLDRLSPSHLLPHLAHPRCDGDMNLFGHVVALEGVLVAEYGTVETGGHVEPAPEELVFGVWSAPFWRQMLCHGPR